MSESVLITGASGFLGYHIIQSAIHTGLKVYAGIRKNSNVTHLKEVAVHYIILNYDDEADIARQLEQNKINYIVHAAGATKAPKPEFYDRINAGYTLNLAKAAERVKGHVKKMVFISSLAASGPADRSNAMITEDMPPNPLTAYGRSKLLAEKNLAGISIPVTILRPTAVYGPRDKDILIVLKTLSRGLDPFIGKFFQRLSFVHVKDVADIAISALFINNGQGIYNITDGKGYDRYKLSDITKVLLNRKAFRFHIPMPLVRLLAFFLETVNGLLKKPSVINREKLPELTASNWVCDISKAKKELAFAPKFDLQSGLEDTIRWYKKYNWL